MAKKRDSDEEEETTEEENHEDLVKTVEMATVNINQETSTTNLEEETSPNTPTNLTKKPYSFENQVTINSAFDRDFQRVPQ